MNSRHPLIIVLIVLFWSCSFHLSPVSAETEMVSLEDQLLDDLPLKDIQDYWSDIIAEYGGFIPDLEKVTVKDFIADQQSLSLKAIVLGLLQFLFHEIILNGKLLGLLLLLTIFSTIVQTMHHAFENSTISQIAYFVVYTVLIYLSLNSFMLVFSYTKEAIDAMSSFMIALIPLVLGLMATFGNVLTVAFFHPLIVFIINLSSVVVATVIMPLLFLSALLMIVSCLNEQYQVTHLAQLFKTVSMAILGGFLTIFLGVMSVQGATTAIQDGVAMKTAKFITGNFIPVIGRTFTDAADTILSASLILKNAVGLVGVIIISLITLFPALKIIAIAFIYKVAAAILQPVSQGPVIQSLHTISHYILLILACLLAVSLMFFLAIVILIIASHMTLLVR